MPEEVGQVYVDTVSDEEVIPEKPGGGRIRPPPPPQAVQWRVKLEDEWRW